MSITNVDYYIIHNREIKIDKQIKQKKIINRPNCLLFMIGFDLKYKYPYDYYDKFIYHIKFKKNIFRDLYQKKRNNTHILIIDCKRGDIDDLLEKYGNNNNNKNNNLDWLLLIENYSGIYFKNYDNQLKYNKFKWYRYIEFDKGYIWNKASIRNVDKVIDPNEY